LPLKEPIGRLAPSPTGLLHVGHARSFLLAWWSIRSRGGTLRLRLEDLDTSRVKPGMEEACLRDLEWLGLDWDGPLLRQSERRDELLGVAHQLLRDGRAYPCVCTRREIAEALSAPHGPLAGGVYPGTCRGQYADLESARRASGREPALRLQVEPGVVRVRDLLAGELAQDVAREVGDFPITSRDGQPAYQLAVVVDDAHQGVTEVLRGDDLLESTPRQRYLQELLGLEVPTWVHVPLVLDVDGQRLAKRHDALSLEALRGAGIDPRCLVCWLARSAGLPAPERATAAELVALYDPASIPREAVIFDPEALSPGT